MLESGIFKQTLFAPVDTFCRTSTDNIIPSALPVRGKNVSVPLNIEFNYNIFSSYHEIYSIDNKAKIFYE